ncbi:hypothetical protein [Streptomyces sp. LS1784]|uniref:hypothetical protein n=1 Tax=Streptomyces sp. LS1784 TaxID=2851533 RepID=UPI001CCBFEA5|nr:hypothetical protein [Streptomyces sp. LS1784]
MTEATEPHVPAQGTNSSVPPTLWQRHQDLLASPGYRALALLDRIKRMSYVLQRNVSQYTDLVVQLQDPSAILPILDVRSPDAHDDLLSEAERLLHNVLTAMSTRVDQQRVFIKKHFEDRPQVQAEYVKRVAEVFHNDPNATFLKDLRNYITHQQLPVAQSRQDWSPTSFSVTFQLPTAPLLQSSKSWSNGVREWLGQLEDGVPIVEVVRDYARLADQFDKWFHERVRHEYADEIEIHLRDRAAYDSAHMFWG